jgi:FkbM family methyltransferase
MSRLRGWPPAAENRLRLSVAARPLAAARRLARAFRLRGPLSALDRRLPHGRRVIPYCGFSLVYSRGNTLVERIVAQGNYEPELTAQIADELGRSRHRTFMDVGANIGIVTLAVLFRVPDARVFAFEPGPHQHDIFAETIRRNALGDSISLSRLALADRPGTRSFAVHAPWHAAGDGFIDTGRSGLARSVTVESDTLDRWWDRAGRPSVDVVKLDTEGSELMILRGGAVMLETCRPVLFLEIHEQNLQAYPYGADDVRAHIEALGYGLKANGRADFVARPR